MITKKLSIAITALTLAVCIVTSVICMVIAIVNASSINFTNPSANLKASDLPGVWITHYTRGTTDTITINVDGTFRQIFEDSQEEYVFDSGWQPWTLEKLENAEIRLHLQGGRFYSEGIPLAERNGRRDPNNPCQDRDCTWGLQPNPFYDPFADELVDMVDKLVLVVLLDSRGNLILHHIWSSVDNGFLLFNQDSEYFTKN